jgi:hypothetical protein
LPDSEECPGIDKFVNDGTFSIRNFVWFKIQCILCDISLDRLVANYGNLSIKNFIDDVQTEK